MYESTAELGTPDNCRDNVTGYANKLVLVALTMHGYMYIYIYMLYIYICIYIYIYVDIRCMATPF